MNPRACSRIGYAVRGAGGVGNLVVRLNGHKVQVELPKVDEWEHYPSHTLDQPLAKGPVSLRLEPIGGSVSGFMLWSF